MHHSVSLNKINNEVTKYICIFKVVKDHSL